MSRGNLFARHALFVLGAAVLSTLVFCAACILTALAFPPQGFEAGFPLVALGWCALLALIQMPLVGFLFGKGELEPRSPQRRYLVGAPVVNFMIFCAAFSAILTALTTVNEAVVLVFICELCAGLFFARTLFAGLHSSGRQPS